jgi:hypothetical protein
MDQFTFPPHVEAAGCPSCANFDYSPELCSRCSDGRLHVLREFNDGSTGARKLHVQCSNYRYEGSKARLDFFAKQATPDLANGNHFYRLLASAEDMPSARRL